MKNSLRQWITVIFLQGIVISFIFSFLIYQTWALYGAYNLILFLLVPLAMLLFTPLWARIKHQTNNQKVIRITSISLWIFISLSLIFPLVTFAHAIIIYGIVLFFLGASSAGLVPFTIEIVRSYYHENKPVEKFYPHLISFWGVIIIPVAFLLEYFLPTYHLGQIIILVLVSATSFLNSLLIWTAKNLQTTEVTFAISKNSWKIIRTNASFWYYLVCSSWQNNLFELVSYLLPTIIFINNDNLLLLLLLIYLLRKIGVFVGNNIKHRFNPKHIIVWIQIIFILALSLMCIFLFCYYFYQNLTFEILYFIFGLFISQFVWGIVAGYHLSSQGQILRALNIPVEFSSLALMFLHVCGRAVGTLLLGLITFLILMHTNFSVYSFSIIFVVFWIISFIILLWSFYFIKIKWIIKK